MSTVTTTWHGMNLFPDQPPPLPAKPRLSAQERRARVADRLKTIRLRVLIGRELENLGISTPTAVAEAIGMPTVAATALLIRKQWREGDVALLETAAARLGLPVSDQGRPLAGSED
jgi:hypothetical protein